MVIYPHKDVRWIPLVMLIPVVLFVGVLCLGWLSGGVKIFAICLIILSLAVCVDTYSLTKIALTIDKEVIALQNTLTKRSTTIHWEALRYGYYVYSSKGKKYMILSTKELSPSVQKKYLRKTTMIMAQFLKESDSKEYLCFSVENNLSNQIVPLIPPHIVMQGNRLYNT